MNDRVRAEVTMAVEIADRRWWEEEGRDAYYAEFDRRCEERYQQMVRDGVTVECHLPKRQDDPKDVS